MAKYRESYVSSHCIDLFFKYQGKDIHVMTDGNMFPEQLDDIDRNRGIQSVVARLTDNLEVNPDNININRGILQYIEGLDADDIERIDQHELLRLFLSMAELGFYSYDCVEQDVNGVGRYVLVAWPKNHHETGIEIPAFDGLMETVERNGDLVEFRM